jgi:hypothetical protein
MPSKTSTHTFNKGMVLDTDKSIIDPRTYRLCHNLRYFADTQEDTGKLYSPKSSGLFTGGLNNNEEIAGDCTIRDYLVLFTYIENTPGVYSFRILRYDIDNPTIATTLWEISSVSDTQYFPFSPNEKLSTVGRYENEDLIKVYWASSDFPIRTANIAEPLRETPSIWLHPDKFNLIPTFDTLESSTNGILVASNNEALISGALTTGRVQHAVSLYKENGQETPATPLTNSSINLFQDSISKSLSCLIEGDSEEVNTGKGVLYNVTLDSSDVAYFDKLRLYRIHYKEYGQLPEITIVSDTNITTTSITLTDTGGEGLGSYTVDEFDNISNIQYNAYEIEEKDNRLIAARLIDNTWDVDYDARAYRFLPSSGVIQASLYSDYTAYGLPDYVISSSGVVTDNVGTGVTDWEDIPIDHNAVCASNDIENDISSLYRFYYKTNGITLGGEGPNVSYSFTYDTSNLILDYRSDLVYRLSTLNYSSKGSTNYDLTSDYSNPMIARNLTGYQRDEIYRFGVVFINDKGQKSTVKWIGDIRIPVGILVNSSADTIVTGGTSIDTDITPVGISIAVTNWPTEAVGYQIVRVPRTEKDKTIVRAGAVIDTLDNPSNYTCKGTDITFADNGATVTNSNSQVVSFINPENIYNKATTIKEGDYLDIVGVATSSDIMYTAELTGDIDFYAYKAFDMTGYSNTTNKRYEISSNQFVPVTYDRDLFLEYNISHAENNTYRGQTGVWGTADVTAHGSCDILSLDTALNNSTLGGTGERIGYGYIKRNTIYRYGGYTYSDRQNNTYIPCGEVYIYTNSEPVWGGDTYIGYFHNLYSMVVDDYAGTAAARVNALLLPVESTINLALDHGFKPSSVALAGISIDYDNKLMKEKAGVHSWNSGANQFTQEEDMYLYNTVYSQEVNINTSSGYYNASPVTDFDTRVAYSDYKLDNETIDSWSKFRPNNYIDVSGKYGPVTKLLSYKNDLFFIQEDAFGILPINQRSLIQDNNIGILQLGTGDVLSRYDYIDKFYGCQDKRSADSSKSGIYYVDKNKRTLLRFNNQGFVNLGVNKGVSSYLKTDTYDGDSIVLTPLVSVNDTNKEAYIYYRTNRTLVYNTTVDMFTSLYTFRPNYITTSDRYTLYKAGTNYGYANNMYALYEGSGHGDFGADPQDYKLTLINNSEYSKTKVYDNLIMHTNHYYLADIYGYTFDEVVFKNDYQSTGDIVLTIEQNLRKREGHYSFVIPRNIINGNEKQNYNVDTNHNAAREFKERMRDKYIETTLTFNNSTDKSNGKFSIDYITYIYRTSAR